MGLIYIDTINTMIKQQYIKFIHALFTILPKSHPVELYINTHHPQVLFKNTDIHISS